MKSQISTMNRFFCAVLATGAFLAVSAHAADSTPMKGWIADKMCAAKHAGSGKACAKKCIEGGAAPVFVDDVKKQVWDIDNPESIKGFYGDHVSIMATADAAKKSVHIDSASALK